MSAALPWLYRTATTALGPLSGILLRRRAARGKEDPNRLAERLGHPSRTRPDGPLVWVHAASVGESLSVLPLIDALCSRRPDLSILMTSGTVTSAKLLAERLPERAFHQFVPIDQPGAVRRFLDHWRPDLALWVESELWPNLVRAAQMRGTRTALIQGRMSARSHRRWQHARGLITPLLAGFDSVLAQTKEDAQRFKELGANAPVVTGTLKYAAPPLPCDAAELAQLRAAIGDRPLWLAASTHPGEDEAALTAHQTLSTNHPTLLTLIAPRHPARGTEIATLARNAGLTVAQRSLEQSVDDKTQIYVTDTIGELGIFYSLAPIAFVGGSLIPRGGQNPIEPIRLGCAVIHGPSMYNFTEVVTALAEANALCQTDTLAATLAPLLASPDALRALSEAQHRVIAQKAGVLDVVLDALAPLLPARDA